MSTSYQSGLAQGKRNSGEGVGGGGGVHVSHVHTNGPDQVIESNFRPATNRLCKWRSGNVLFFYYDWLISIICFRVFFNALSAWCSSYLITEYSGGLQFPEFMITTNRSKRTRIFGMVEKRWSKSLECDLYFQRLSSLTGLSKKRLVSLQIKVRGDENF